MLVVNVEGGAMKNKYSKVGIDFDKREAGEFLLDNKDITICRSKGLGIELTNTNDACKKYSDVRKKKWFLIKKDSDEITKKVSEGFDNGYFVRSKKGTKTDGFVQTCLSIKDKGVEQNVHNIIIAEDFSEMHIVTGCLTVNQAKNGKHNGVTEMYVGKGAKLTFTMVHSWSDDTIVRPKTVVWVDEGGQFISNYICIDRVADLKMYPRCILAGKKSYVNMNSYILARKGSIFDIGAGVELRGENSSCLIKARIVSMGGEVVNRGIMEGVSRGVKGHLECSGLIVGKGLIHAIPEIKANLANVDLTHEASIGKISSEVLEYLQTRGLTASGALELILRGFLDINNVSVPRTIAKRLSRIPVEKGMTD